MTAVPQGLKIKFVSQSSKPWRITNESGRECTMAQKHDDPTSDLWIEVPYAAETLDGLVELLLRQLSETIAHNVNLRQELAILKRENA